MSFMERAEQFLEMAKTALARDMYNVAAFNAGQAAINANDAVAIKYLNRRASRDHSDALQLHKEIVQKTGDSGGRQHLAELVESRRIYGYTNRECGKTEAERFVRSAEKFLAWARKALR